MVLASNMNFGLFLILIGNYILKYLQKPIEIDLLIDIVTEIVKN